MIQQLHKTSLTKRIFIAMLFGLVIGSGINAWGKSAPTNLWITMVDTYFIEHICYVVGSLFLNSLNMLIVPLVVISLICGISTNHNNKQLSRIGCKTFVLYLSTTAIAITIALLIAALSNPGVGIELPQQTSFSPSPKTPLIEILANLIPKNPILAMSEGNMLQVIAFSILVGVAINLTTTSTDIVCKLLNQLNDVLLKLVQIIMEFAPYGVFALVIKIFRELGLSAFEDLAIYMVVVIIALVVHAGITYGGLIAIYARLNPLTFVKKIAPAQVFAFSTASSSATMPVTMKTCEDSMGVHNSVASFTIPLGATINMDGTAIMQGVATVFIANMSGIDLSVSAYLTIILTATLASIGTAGVPSAGLITLTMVLSQVNLPAEPIAMIIGVDRILDMIRTAINVSGDAAVTLAIARSENLIDIDRYNDPNS